VCTKKHHRGLFEPAESCFGSNAMTRSVILHPQPTAMGRSNTYNDSEPDEKSVIDNDDDTQQYPSCCFVPAAGGQVSSCASQLSAQSSIRSMPGSSNRGERGSGELNLLIESNHLQEPSPPISKFDRFGYRGRRSGCFHVGPLMLRVTSRKQKRGTGKQAWVKCLQIRK